MVGPSSTAVLALCSCAAPECEPEILTQGGGMPDIPECDRIPIPNVDGKTLRYLLEYVEKHGEELSTESAYDRLEWDLEYVSRHQAELLKINEVPHTCVTRRFIWLYKF
jgi:hypothetical protein